MPSYQDIATRLRDAYAGGAIPPLRDALEPTDADGAYAVQTINTRVWEGEGRRIVGRKAGLKAKAVQTELGVDQHDIGAVMDDMRVCDARQTYPAKKLQAKDQAGNKFGLGAE